MDASPGCPRGGYGLGKTSAFGLPAHVPDRPSPLAAGRTNARSARKGGHLSGWTPNARTPPEPDHWTGPDLRRMAPSERRLDA
jgi:hypothetical protein